MSAMDKLVTIARAEILLKLITSNPRVSCRADYIHTSLADTACLPGRARKSHAGICMKRNDFRKCENELAVRGQIIRRRRERLQRARETRFVYCMEYNMASRWELIMNHADTRECTTIIAFYNGNRSRNVRVIANIANWI